MSTDPVLSSEYMSASSRPRCARRTRRRIPCTRLTRILPSPTNLPEESWISMGRGRSGNCSPCRTYSTASCSPRRRSTRLLTESVVLSLEGRDAVGDEIVVRAGSLEGHEIAGVSRRRTIATSWARSASGRGPPPARRFRTRCFPRHHRRTRRAPSLRGATAAQDALPSCRGLREDRRGCQPGRSVSIRHPVGDLLASETRVDLDCVSVPAERKAELADHIEPSAKWELTGTMEPSGAVRATVTRSHPRLTRRAYPLLEDEHVNTTSVPACARKVSAGSLSAYQLGSLSNPPTRRLALLVHGIAAREQRGNAAWGRKLPGTP